MNLQYFPMDRQLCHIEIESCKCARLLTSGQLSCQGLCTYCRLVAQDTRAPHTLGT